MLQSLAVFRQTYKKNKKKKKVGTVPWDSDPFLNRTVAPFWAVETKKKPPSGAAFPRHFTNNRQPD